MYRYVLVRSRFSYETSCPVVDEVIVAAGSRSAMLSERETATRLFRDRKPHHVYNVYTYNGAVPKFIRGELQLCPSS